MSNEPIRVWQFHLAPMEYQLLSLHGGDEDWVVELPAGVERPAWTEYGPLVVCDVSEHHMPDGKTILISAHA